MEIEDNTSLNMPIQRSLKASLLQPYTSWMWTRNSPTRSWNNHHQGHVSVNNSTFIHVYIHLLNFFQRQERSTTTSLAKQIVWTSKTQKSIYSTQKKEDNGEIESLFSLETISKHNQTTKIGSFQIIQKNYADNDKNLKEKKWVVLSEVPTNEIGDEISKALIISKNIPNGLRIRIDPDFASYPPFPPRDHINLTTHFSFSSLVET